MTRRLLCLLLPLLLASTALAQAPKFRFIQGPKAGGGEVKWTVAENGTVEVEKDEYVLLEREVRIEYQDIKLQADKVTYNLRTKDVNADGHVIIDQGPTRVTASNAVYNLESKTGTFFNSTATMDPSMYFAGDRIEKVDEDTFRLTNGVFTSCDLDQPAWSFRVGSADVTLDDYAYMKDISFRAGKVPVFWAPRLVWPTKRDRSKGFLIPRALFSTRFGQRLEIGYYLPVGESADVTAFADLNTKGFFGTGVEVRYVPSENVKIGQASGHIVNNPEALRVNELDQLEEVRRTEWKYELQHAQENLPGGFRGVVDIQDYSDLDFFREYDRDSRFQTLSNIYSSAYLTRNRPKYSLNVLSDRRDLVAPDNSRQRFEQLPSLQLRMYPQRVGNTPLYFSMESSTSRLRTGGVSATGVRTINEDYQRADIFPTLSLQLRTPSWFSVKPEISARQTWYSQSLDDTTTPDVKEDDSISRFYAQGQVEVVGPSFSRVFNRTIGNFLRFKHVIEPRFRYVYTSDVDNQNRIVRFDTVDSPYLPIVRDSVEYSLTQRILGKEAGENGNSREVLSFSLRQSVALSDPFPRAGGSPSLAGEHKFTPLFATLRVNPYQSMTVDATATFGNVSHQLDQVSLSANLVGTGANADKYLGLTYFASLLQPGQSEESDSSQVRVRAGSSLVKDRIRTDIELNFDAERGTFLEQRYVTGWTGSCYGIALGFRRYNVFVPGGTGGIIEKPIGSFDIAITLKNVGTIGTH
ncbi:MAG TPA: LPS assembly protein LptD [Thermoanaerobaculia bacterium]|jgi:LPS-assembly protein